MGSSFIELPLIQVIAVSFSEAPLSTRAKLYALINSSLFCAFICYCNFSQPPPPFILQPITLYVRGTA